MPDPQNGHYTCCKCKEDMTKQVNKAFADEEHYPMFQKQLNKIKATSVIVQCSKGHWCEYDRKDHDEEGTQL